MEKEFLDRFKALFDQGLTYAKIGEALGISRARAAEIGRRHFVQPGEHRNTAHNMRKKDDPNRDLPYSQIRTLSAIYHLTKFRGNPPTLQDIADQICLSKSAVYFRVRTLLANNLVKRAGRCARSLTLTEAGSSIVQRSIANA